MICVDASLVVKWLVKEEDSTEAMNLYWNWVKNDCILIAPTLLDYEIGSVLVNKIRQKNFPSEDLNVAVHFYRKLPLQLFHEINLLEKAVSLARDFNERTIYDCSYLSLALLKDAELFTADLQFFQKASSSYPCVKYFKN